MGCASPESGSSARRFSGTDGDGRAYDVSDPEQRAKLKTRVSTYANDPAVFAKEVGLSEELADRLEAWMDAFDAIYDEDDPAASGFGDPVELLAWEAAGAALAHAIGDELGAG